MDTLQKITSPIYLLDRRLDSATALLLLTVLVMSKYNFPSETKVLAVVLSDIKSYR